MTTISPSYEIRQSNVLTEARFTLTACQLDIYFYLLSILRKNDEPEKFYDIYVTQIEELTGRKWNYQQLRESTKDLLGKVIEFDDLEGNFCQTSLISSAKYIKKTGCVRVTVSYLIRPLLWDLKQQYTSFQLYCALAMTSKFAKRIYLLCSEWKNNLVENGATAVSKTYTIDELRYILGLSDPTGKEPDQYKQWGEFKENVLEISKKQINQYSDLKINYRVQKQGRSYQLIQFSISQNNDHQLIIDFNQEDLKERIELTNRKVYLVEKYKLSDKQANTVVRRLEVMAVKDLLDEVNKANDAGKVKNIGAYTVAAIKNQFGIEL
jgi:plasmid replication initiation protein